MWQVIQTVQYRRVLSGDEMVVPIFVCFLHIHIQLCMNKIKVFRLLRHETVTNEF